MANIKKKFSDKQRVKHLTNTVLTLLDKIKEQDDRLKKLEDWVAGIESVKQQMRSFDELPVSSFGLKNPVKDFKEAVVLPEAEVVTYLPEDEDEES